MDTIHILTTAVDEPLLEAIRAGTSEYALSFSEFDGKTLAGVPRDQSSNIVIIGSEDEHPLQLAQSVSAHLKQSDFFILCSPETLKSTQQAVLVSPFLSAETRCIADDNVPGIVAAVRKMLMSCNRRRRNSAMVQLASASLGAQQPTSTAHVILDRLLENAPIGVAVCDSDTKILAWNQSAQKITGISERIALGRNLGETLKPFDRIKLTEILNIARAGVKPNDATTIQLNINPESPVYIDLKIAQLDSTDNGRLMIMFSDVTEQMNAMDRLMQTERLSLVGAMVAGVAHELNTPLGVIVTAASILNDSVGQLQHLTQEFDADRLSTLAMTLETAAELIVSNTDKAAELVNTFRHVSVDQTQDDISEFNLCTILQSAITHTASQWQQVADTVALECPATINMHSYAGALLQVINSLISGSVKHAFEDDERGTISISVTESQDAIVLHYADSGCGMAPEHARRIFEPFFTTRRNRGGVGLSMHIVHNLTVARLKGSIRVDTAPGKGFNCYIRIPTNAQDVDTLQTA